MPVDLELFLSGTRPNPFSYSPFVDDRYRYASGYDDRDLRSISNSFYLKSSQKHYGFRSVFPPFEPVVQSKSKTRKESTVELPDGSRKKKVSFADDKGLNLVQVREIPGSPKWTDQVLTLLTSVPKSDLFQGKEWVPAFEHPPWKDEALLERLGQKALVLESIHVKNTTLYGTLKVKNLAFEKNVFVRMTFDRWISNFDVKASYVTPKLKSQRASRYDTFSFSTKISPTALRYEVIELCVCFQCNGREYWDNNGGINYRLVVDSSGHASNHAQQYQKEKLQDNQITLSLTENIENISEIKAWSNFMYNQPYW